MKSKTKNKLLAFVKEAIRAAVAAIMGVVGAALAQEIRDAVSGITPASLVAADGLTKAVDITVVSTEDGQRIVCALASAVPAGTYYVRLVSHGLDPTAPLSTVLHRVTVRAAAPVPPGPIAQTSDGQVKVMSVTDGGQSETFTFGDEWTAGGEGFVGSEAQWFAELALLRPTPDGNPVNVVYDVASDAVLTVTGSTEDAPAAGDYPNAVLEIGMARDDAGELVTEALSIPIHLVVNG